MKQDHHNWVSEEGEREVGSCKGILKQEEIFEKPYLIMAPQPLVCTPQVSDIIELASSLPQAFAYVIAEGLAKTCCESMLNASEAMISCLCESMAKCRKKT